MKKNTHSSIKLRSISIKNYKGIDSFKMDFPMPILPDDPDILVMGSENGLGKTSIMECCALLLMCLDASEKSFRIRNRYSTIDIPDFIIRAGETATTIRGKITADNSTEKAGITIDRNGMVAIERSNTSSKAANNEFVNVEDVVDELIKTICGFSSDPVLEDSFLLFHSHRRVQEGNPELGMMVDDSRFIRLSPPRRRMEMPLSEFKLLILRSLMNKAGLFELESKENPKEIIEKLNELVQTYAGGKIDKLRPAADSTVDFRITPVSAGESFTFDGLSSGQKEIISTLFLIWHHTRNKPAIVFIDEPELHLNVQWHRTLINSLIKLAPKNQYIMATHSKDIMDSVAKDRRILLVDEKMKASSQSKEINSAEKETIPC